MNAPGRLLTVFRFVRGFLGERRRGGAKAVRTCRDQTGGAQARAAVGTRQDDAEASGPGWMTTAKPGGRRPGPWRPGRQCEGQDARTCRP